MEADGTVVVPEVEIMDVMVEVEVHHIMGHSYLLEPLRELIAVTEKLK